ncbi:hypothetical protein ACFL2Z_01090 [Candidatus Eisenbacteria bacterium]|uniref:Outer membrane protein beta-barrel domain-containing protein n=1 Tax=Eiseniibacteriota bacterium TaxID=2212470 RepID=A0ABV6YN45_UNCEI
MLKALSLVVLSAALLAFGTAVMAEDEAGGERETWRRFDLGVGGFLNAVNSSIMLGAEGVGVNIDVEELLGLKSRTTAFRAAGFWRYTENRRHRLELSWFAVRRSTDHVIDRNIDLGDTLFLEGTLIKSSLDIDIIKVAYGYSFFQDDRVDLAVSGGFFVMPLGFEASVTKETTRSTRSADITAPLPVLGFRTDIALTPRWYLRSGFQLFYIEIGDFRGGITDLTGVVEYVPYDNLGFGLGFESFALSVEAQGSDYPGIDFKGRLDFEYVGLLFYVKGMW